MRQGSAMVQQAAEPRTEVLWVEGAVRGRTTENRFFQDDPNRDRVRPAPFALEGRASRPPLYHCNRSGRSRRGGKVHAGLTDFSAGLDLIRVSVASG
jgi:hypothetical protein